MHDAVPPGKAGWFLVIEQVNEGKFMAAIEDTTPTLVRSTLTEEQEKELEHAFGAKKHSKEGSGPRQRVTGGRATEGARPRR